MELQDISLELMLTAPLLGDIIKSKYSDLDSLMLNKDEIFKIKVLSLRIHNQIKQLLDTIDNLE